MNCAEKLSFWGSYFISIDPESVNPSFALFDCLGAILCDLLIAGLIGLDLSVRCI